MASPPAATAAMLSFQQSREKHLARHAQRRRRGQAHQWRCRLNPACSHDGKWVVYSSMNQAVPRSGGSRSRAGTPTPLILTESFDALPSPSGRMIYYSTYEWEERPVRVRVLRRWIVISSTRSEAAVRFRLRRRCDHWGAADLGAGRERPRLRRDPERRVQYLAAAAHRRATRADHALQHRKDLQLRVVARWPMAVARQRLNRSDVVLMSRQP